MKARCRPPQGPAPATTVQVDNPESTAAAVRQLAPIGPHPGVSILLVGSLLWSSSADAADVLDHVHDDDLADPALAAVLAALRRLVDAGRSHGPQLVLDELRRSGTVSTSVAEQLKAATVSGADPLAARHYAAATVADSLRRRVESVGVALVSAAEDAAEADLSRLIAQGAASVADCAHRLELLRGEPI